MHKTLQIKFITENQKQNTKFQYSIKGLTIKSYLSVVAPNKIKLAVQIVRLTDPPLQMIKKQTYLIIHK